MSSIYPDLRLVRSEEEDVGDDPSVIAPFRLVMPKSTLAAPPRAHDAHERFCFDGDESGGEQRLYQPRPQSVPR